MTQDTVISFVCSCGKRLRAPAAAKGRTGRCPACRAEFVVGEGNFEKAVQRPIAKTPAVPAAALEDPFANDDAPDNLMELGGAALEVAGNPPTPLATAIEPNPPPAPAPTLNYAAPAGRARWGPSAKAKPNQPVDYMAPDGPLGMGILVSAGLALAVSVLWIAIAFFTGLEIRLLAALIGVAAGVGMQIGQRGYSAKGGMIAAGITLVTIMLAKFIVLQVMLTSLGIRSSIFSHNGAVVAGYFFNMWSTIYLLVGMAAAYRTANGSVSG